MKYFYTLILSVIIITVFSQSEDSTKSEYKNVYYESNYEFMFQFGFIETDEQLPVKLRFSGFYHTEELIHIDFGKRLGLFTGIGLRNVGLVEVNEDESYKMKRRTYMLGVPLAFKLGAMRSKRYIYVGGEMELAFHYKQKMFKEDMKKKTYKEWFSNRINMWHPSVFVGIKFKDDYSLRVKYYYENFLNNSFKGNDFDVPRDYSMYKKSNILYLSFIINLSSDNLKERKNDDRDGVTRANYYEL